MYHTAWRIRLDIISQGEVLSNTERKRFVFPQASGVRL